jgi:hypothetical protein
MGAPEILIVFDPLKYLAQDQIGEPDPLIDKLLSKP